MADATITLAEIDAHVAALEKERAPLAARLAEIDAILRRLKSKPRVHSAGRPRCSGSIGAAIEIIRERGPMRLDDLAREAAAQVGSTAASAKTGLGRARARGDFVLREGLYALPEFV